MAVPNKINNFKDTFVSNSSLTMKEQLGYGGGIFGNCMGQDCVGTYDDKFCRDYMGLDAGKMLVKGNISTILGFLIPPVAGAWYDSPVKAGKMGHLRKALFIAPIPFAITSLLLFVVPSSNPTYNFIWSLFLGLIFTISDTFYDIAMSALGLRMCTNPKDRKNFFTFTSIASTVGSMLPGWILPLIVGLAKDDVKKEQLCYFLVALGFCIIGVAAMYAPYLTIKDKAELAVAKEDEEKNGIKVQWNKETLSAILHNRPFMVLQVSLLFDMIRQITYKTLPYLYRDVFDNYGMKSIIDMISGALSYVGLFSVPFVGSKVSARTMVAGGYAYTSVFYVIASLFGINFSVEKVRKNKWLIGVLIGMAGMPNSAQGAARKIITADSTDYMEHYSFVHFGSGVRSDGILSAAGNIVTKICELGKTNLYNILFAVVKYKEKAVGATERPVQTPETIRGLYLMVVLCGFIGNFLSAICFLFDNYTGQRKEKIQAELVELRAKYANGDKIVVEE